MIYLHVNEIWKQCLAIIRDNISEQSFQTWFIPIKPVKLEEYKLTIQVPSQYSYEWLEENYVDLLSKTIKRVIHSDAQLEYRIILNENERKSDTNNQGDNNDTVNPVDETPGTIFSNVPPPPKPDYNPPNPDYTPPEKPNEYNGADPYKGGGKYVNSNDLNNNDDEEDINNIFPQDIKNPFILAGLSNNFDDVSQLNKNYSFNNFVEGSCNELARSASFAVANKPADTAFNPLFLYGGVGLGKTHLAHALGNHIRIHFPKKRVLYVSSEKFTNQFINALKGGSINNFTYFYQHIDVLIVDDIQFLSNKDRTQDIFFHIFNHLHQTNKQIVLTSDRSPKELKGIEDRLLSRFKWGLNADLKRPDYETRVAILQTKMKSEGVVLPRDVIDYFAHHIDTNIRELEGALVQLIARDRLTSAPIDLETSKTIVRSIVDKVKNEGITLQSIIKTCCEYYDVKQEEVIGKSRKREVTQPRQISMYFAKQFTNLPLTKIGEAFGGRDHSTVIHSCSVVQNLMDTEEDYRYHVEEIEKILKRSK